MNEARDVLDYLVANRGRALTSGWVGKQPVDRRSVFNRFWRRKWMELYPQLLVWYNSDEPNTAPRAYMMLAATTVVREATGKVNAIEVVSASGRTLRFRSEQRHHEWLMTITQVLQQAVQEQTLQPAPISFPSDEQSGSDAALTATAVERAGGDVAETGADRGTQKSDSGEWPAFPMPPRRAAALSAGSGGQPTPPAPSGGDGGSSQTGSACGRQTQAAAGDQTRGEHNSERSGRSSVSAPSGSERSSAGESADSPGSRKRLRQHSLYRLRTLEESERSGRLSSYEPLPSAGDRSPQSSSDDASDADERVGQWVAHSRQLRARYATDEPGAASRPAASEQARSARASDATEWAAHGNEGRRGGCGGEGVEAGGTVAAEESDASSGDEDSALVRQWAAQQQQTRQGVPAAATEPSLAAQPLPSAVCTEPPLRGHEPDPPRKKRLSWRGLTSVSTRGRHAATDTASQRPEKEGVDAPAHTETAMVRSSAATATTGSMTQPVTPSTAGTGTAQALKAPGSADTRHAFEKPEAAGEHSPKRLRDRDRIDGDGDGGGVVSKQAPKLQMLQSWGESSLLSSLPASAGSGRGGESGVDAVGADEQEERQPSSRSRQSSDWETVIVI